MVWIALSCIGQEFEVSNLFWLHLLWKSLAAILENSEILK